MQKLEPRKSLLISGPIWLFQLWFTATFEPKLHTFVPKDYAEGVNHRRVKGTSLALLTRRRIGCSTKDLFLRLF